MRNQDTNKKTESILIGIGDLHGYYPALSRLLETIDEEYAIFESEDKLRPGVKIKTTGDYIDRNNQALRIINRIKKLQKLNPDSVDPLMGNHEIMALKTLDTAKRLAEAETPEKYRQTMHGQNGGMEFIFEFDSENSKNAIKEYAKRMSREGDIGSWMRSLIPYKIEKFQNKKILFTHADIPRELWDTEKLKEYVEHYQERVKETSTSAYSSEKKYGELEDPLFERLFRELSPTEFYKMINSLKVDYIVTGHTPSLDNKIVNYFDKTFDIDVGMWHDSCYDPIAIIFKKEGIYEFNANKGEKKLASFE
jgi:hypothetical protein